MNKPGLILALLVSVLFLAGACQPRSSAFHAHSLTITPSEVVVGETVLIEFWMDNSGYRGVLTEITLKIDDDVVQTKEVRARPNHSTKAFFRVRAETVGTHTVSIHNVGIKDMSGVFTVVASD